MASIGLVERLTKDCSPAASPKHPFLARALLFVHIVPIIPSALNPSGSRRRTHITARAPRQIPRDHHAALIFRFAPKHSLRLSRNGCKTPTRTIGNPLSLSVGKAPRKRVSQIHCLEWLVFRSAGADAVPELHDRLQSFTSLMRMQARRGPASRLRRQAF